MMRCWFAFVMVLAAATGAWASRCKCNLQYPKLDGYGEKVDLSFTSGAIAVGAEGNNTATSGAYVSLWSGKGCTYNTPIELKPPKGLNTSDSGVEFGTQVSISDDGKTVLVVVDEIILNITEGTQMVDLGYVYKYKDSKTYSLVSTLKFPVTPENKTGFDQFEIQDATGSISKDGKTVSITFTGTLAELNKTDPSESIREEAVAGVVAVFKGTSFGLYTIINAPTQGVVNATFGRNIGMSGDGNTIAISDDITASIYIFEHNARNKSYPLVQTITDAIPVVNASDPESGRGQMEKILVSYNGAYLATVYGNYQAEQDNSTDPLQDAGGIKMYLRSNMQYSAVCNMFPIYNQTGSAYKDADGGDMADLRDVQRVVAGFAGSGALVVDFKHKDLAVGICPKWATVVLDPSVNAGIDVNDISEAVSISGNGYIVAQGWSTFNGTINGVSKGNATGAVLFTSIHAPIYYYNKTGPVYV